MLYSSGTTGRPKGIIRPLPEQPPSQQLPLFDFLQKLWRYREGLVYYWPQWAQEKELPPIPVRLLCIRGQKVNVWLITNVVAEERLSKDRLCAAIARTNWRVLVASRMPLGWQKKVYRFPAAQYRIVYERKTLTFGVDAFPL